jgi:hypothetical protein
MGNALPAARHCLRQNPFLHLWCDGGAADHAQVRTLLGLAIWPN